MASLLLVAKVRLWPKRVHFGLVSLSAHHSGWRSKQFLDPPCSAKVMALPLVRAVVERGGCGRNCVPDFSDQARGLRLHWGHIRNVRTQLFRRRVVPVGMVCSPWAAATQPVKTRKGTAVWPSLELGPPGQRRTNGAISVLKAARRRALERKVRSPLTIGR